MSVTHTVGSSVPTLLSLPSLQASFLSSPGPLQTLFPPPECCSFLSCSTSFLLTSTQPSFPPAGVIRGASTFHSAVRSPDLFVHCVPQFSSRTCLHSSVIWFPFKDLSLLTFPIHSINFSLFGGEKDENKLRLDYCPLVSHTKVCLHLFLEKEVSHY